MRGSRNPLGSAGAAPEVGDRLASLARCRTLLLDQRERGLEFSDRSILVIIATIVLVTLGVGSLLVSGLGARPQSGPAESHPSEPEPVRFMAGEPLPLPASNDPSAAASAGRIIGEALTSAPGEVDGVLRLWSTASGRGEVAALLDEWRADLANVLGPHGSSELVVQTIGQRTMALGASPEGEIRRLGIVQSITVRRGSDPRAPAVVVRYAVSLAVSAVPGGVLLHDIGGIVRLPASRELPAGFYPMV